MGRGSTGANGCLVLAGKRPKQCGMRRNLRWGYQGQRTAPRARGWRPLPFNSETLFSTRWLALGRGGRAAAGAGAELAEACRGACGDGRVRLREKGRQTDRQSGQGKWRRKGCYGVAGKIWAGRRCGQNWLAIGLREHGGGWPRHGAVMGAMAAAACGQA